MNRTNAMLLGPAIFGSLDGADSIIGIINGVPADHMVKACIGGAVSAGMSMGVGSLLSREGRAKSLVLGTATAAGTVLPSLPYLWARGPAAIAGIGVVMLLLGAVISVVHTRLPVAEGEQPETLRSAATKTYLALLLVCGAVALCAAATGGAG